MQQEQPQPQPPASSGEAPEGRRCFVTVGATASFLRLLQEVLDPAFLTHLGARGFSELVVQTGPDHGWARGQIEALGRSDEPRDEDEQPQPQPQPRWPVIRAVSYTTDMTALMVPCRGGGGQGRGEGAAPRRRPGAMISHAGAGSILDAVRCDVPLVVVANPDLLGNHQAELADAVHEAGWAIKGALGHLADALDRLLQKTEREGQDGVPAAYEEPPFPTPEDERCGLFDWAAMYVSHLAPLGPDTAEPERLHLD